MMSGAMVRISNKVWELPLSVWILLAYTLFSVLFARERILNTDCSYQLFSSVNDGGFFFQESRYGAFITQLPMVIGLWTHAPMLMLLHLYSFGFPLVYGLSLWIALRVFRCPEAALTAMLSLLVGTGATFFHCTTETHLLVVLSSLLHGAFSWLRSVHARRGYPVVVILILWCLFTHPNALFTVAFVAGLALLRGWTTLREVAWTVALCAIFFGARLLTMRKGGYDDHQYEKFMGFVGRLPGFWKAFAFWWFGDRFWNETMALLVLVVAVLLFYRRWRELLHTVISAAFFFVITVLTFFNGDSDAMMEKSFMPMVFMFAVPFSAMCFRPIGGRWFRLVALVMCAQALVNITVSSRPHVARLNSLRELIASKGANAPKMILLDNEAVHPELHRAEWATSMDALMLSRCMGDSARTIFMTKDTVEFIPELSDTSIFLYRKWDPYAMSLKNRYYFNLPNQPYRIVHLDVGQSTGLVGSP